MLEGRSALSTASLLAHSDEVAKLLENKVVRADINKLDDSGCSPLYFAVTYCFPFSLEGYRTIILLLEAHADPLLFQRDPKRSSYPVAPLFTPIWRDDLATLRLMLWYAPDCEEVRQQCDSSKQYTLLELAKWLSLRTENKDRGAGHDFAYYVTETLTDAKKVRKLTTKALRLIGEAEEARDLCVAVGDSTVFKSTEDDVKKNAVVAKKYRRAAKRYEEVAKIYQKHAALEDVLIYILPSYASKDSTKPSEYREILKAHYQKKSRDCLGQLYLWYQIIDDSLSSTGLYMDDVQDLKYHVSVLDRLVELSSIFDVKNKMNYEIKRREYQGQLYRCYKMLDATMSLGFETKASAGPGHADVLDALIQLGRILGEDKEVIESYLIKAAFVRSGVVSEAAAKETKLVVAMKEKPAGGAGAPVAHSGAADFEATSWLLSYFRGADPVPLKDDDKLSLLGTGAHSSST